MILVRRFMSASVLLVLFFWSINVLSKNIEMLQAIPDEESIMVIETPEVTLSLIEALQQHIESKAKGGETASALPEITSIKDQLIELQASLFEQLKNQKVKQGSSWFLEEKYKKVLSEQQIMMLEG